MFKWKQTKYLNKMGMEEEGDCHSNFDKPLLKFLFVPLISLVNIRDSVFFTTHKETHFSKTPAYQFCISIIFFATLIIQSFMKNVIMIYMKQLVTSNLFYFIRKYIPHTTTCIAKLYSTKDSENFFFNCYVINVI